MKLRIYTDVDEVFLPRDCVVQKMSDSVRVSRPGAEMEMHTSDAGCVAYTQGVCVLIIGVTARVLVEHLDGDLDDLLVADVAVGGSVDAARREAKSRMRDLLIKENK